MTDDSVATILSRIEASQDLYHRLILVVGPCGSGKSATLRAVSAHAGAPVLNLNLELSRRLLDFTARQRLLEVPRMPGTWWVVTGGRGGWLWSVPKRCSIHAVNALSIRSRTLRYRAWVSSSSAPRRFLRVP